MKLLPLVIGAALAAATSHATLIDLGASGPISERSRTFSGLEGTQFAGQSVSLDFNFANNEFIRVYSTERFSSFRSLLSLQTNTPFPGFLVGNGYVIDSLGQRYSGSTGAGMSSDGSTGMGLFPFWFDTGSPIPGSPSALDIYGIHYDLTLPTTTATQILSSRLGIFGLEIPNREGFEFFGTIGIGPGIPDEIPPVPDTGSTLLLLSLALVPMLLHYDRRIRLI